MKTRLLGQSGLRISKTCLHDARLALAENGGGVMGFDEAACAITILEKDR